MRATKQIGYHRPVKRAQAHEIKGVVWFGLFFMALLAYAVWASVYIYSNRQNIAVGQSVDCVGRVSYDYFRFCNAQVDGAACMWASQSRMLQFYEPIDYACAQFEPQRAFVFEVRDPETEPLEVAEQVG